MRKTLLPALLPVLFVVCAALSGCSAKTEVTYQQPQGYPLENSAVYDAALEKVWDAAVASLGGDFFTLERAQRDSRTITLSFAAETPSDYVDCGVLTYMKTGGPGPDETVTVAGAAPVVKYLYADGTTDPREVVRTTSLSGTLDVVFSAEGKGKTRATVKTRYTLSVVNRGDVPVTYGFSEGHMPVAANTSVVFSSGQTGRMHGGGLTQCVATSALEQKVLAEIQALLP